MSNYLEQFKKDQEEKENMLYAIDDVIAYIENVRHYWMSAVIDSDTGEHKRDDESGDYLYKEPEGTNPYDVIRYNLITDCLDLLHKKAKKILG